MYLSRKQGWSYLLFLGSIFLEPKDNNDENIQIFYLIPNTFPVIVIEMFFESATAGKNEASIVPDIPDTMEQRHVLRKHSARDTRDFIFFCLGGLDK